MESVIKKITAELPPLSSERVTLIAIDGCGGAGKSTIASKLVDSLPGSQIVHIDDFYKPKERRVEVTAQTSVHVNFEFDRLKSQVIEPLRNGLVSRYTTPNGDKVEVMPKGYVIIEGLGALGPTLKRYFDYKVWINALESTRRSRGIERDTEEWARIWDEEYLPQDARYVSEESPQMQADLIIDNT